MGATGAAVAALGLCHHGLLFLLLWAGYLGLYGVGQTFYSFQWDILLLEAGFATVLYAPWGFPRLPGFFQLGGREQRGRVEPV